MSSKTTSGRVLLGVIFGVLGSLAIEGSCETSDGRFEETCLIDVAKAENSDVDSNYKRPPWFGDLPFTKLKNNVLCEHAPCSEQVHLQIGGVNEMVVSFVSSAETHAGPYVFYWEQTMGSCSDASSRRNATGTTEQYSLLMYFSHQLWDPRMGAPSLTAEELAEMRSTEWCKDTSSGWKYPCYHYFTAENVSKHSGGGRYYNFNDIYDSPNIHTVVLKGLVPNKRYCYSVHNDQRVFSFKMPADSGSFPYKVGLIADAGQTAASKASFDLLRKIDPEVVLFAGDLSYADGFGPRWDSFGRLFERLGASTPMAYCPGNHEDGMGEGHVHYKERYPMKFAAQASGSSNPLFWSRNLGPLHVISLNSYAQSHPSSSMHRWLKKDLASFNRSKTPWLVVMMHSPWYNSNKGHIGESIPMKGHMESLFYDHGVNVVLSGHVHSYERTKNIYQNDTNPCGPVYLNLGDGGNREGPYTNWLPGSTPGSRRPSWTAFRQGSFGVAELEVANSTHAKFKWSRLACFDNDLVVNSNCSTEGDTSMNALQKVDEAWIIRPVTCTNN